MKKKIVIIMGLCAIFFVAFVIRTKMTSPSAKRQEISSVRVTQTVTIDGKKKTATSVFQKGETALKLLDSTHTVTTKGKKENAFVTAIDGRIANAEKEFWSFYVNGKQASVGAGSYLLRNNDTIEWKIEAFK